MTNTRSYFNAQPNAVAVIRQAKSYVDVPRPLLSSASTLTARRLSARVTDDGRVVVDRDREPLLDSADFCRPSAGMAYPVADFLQWLGHDVRVIAARQRNQELPAPDLSSVPSHLPVDVSYLTFLRMWRSGVIVHEAGVSVWWLIAQAAFVWPAARISVIVTSKTVGRRGAKRLRSWGIKLSQVTSRDCPGNPKRIVISTPMGLAHDQIEHDQRDLVFYVAAADVAQEKAQIPLLAAEASFGYFGFLATDCRVSPYEEARLLATFGVTRLSIPAHGHVSNSVTVLWQHFTDDAVCDGSRPLEVKRFGIWRHRKRNRQVARIATAIAANDFDSLRRCAPRVARDLPLIPGRGIAVVCDNSEHLNCFATLLPGWTTRDGQSPDAIPAPFGMPLPYPRLLLTTTAMTALDLTNVDVVIWAGSGPGIPDIPASRLQSFGTIEKPLWVIDLQDHHHPLLARWSQQRRTAYTEHGWLEPGVAPERILIQRAMSRQEA